MSRSTDRPRGILSPADRAFLLGEADLDTEQSIYDTRYRIRQRVRHAILDFTLLFEHLADRDRDQVFDSTADDRDAFTEAIINALAFFYLGTEGHDPPRENLLAESVRRAERRSMHGDPAIITAHVTVEHAGRDRLSAVLDRIEAGDFHELTDDDLRAFAQLCSEGCDIPPREALERRLDDRS